MDEKQSQHYNFRIAMKESMATGATDIKDDLKSMEL